MSYSVATGPFEETDSDWSDIESDSDSGQKCTLKPNPRDLGSFNYRTSLPQNGSQYLVQVMKEARRIPKCAVAKVPEELDPDLKPIQEKPERPYFTLLPKGGDGDEGVGWTKDWELNQIAVFTCLRSKMDSWRMLIEAGKVRVPCRVIMPSTKEGWSLLTFGPTLHAELSQKEGGASKPLIAPPPSDSVRPFLSTVLAIGQRRSEQLLAFHVRWLRDYGWVNACQGEWLYSLFVALQTPLEASVVGDLREVARVCRKTRSEVKGSDEFRNSMNLFILLVSEYFGQRDLGDSQDP